MRDALVMIADTRTNAGLDNISTFRKLHVFTQPGERVLAIASSGNLSFAPSVRSTLTEGIENPETGELETLLDAPPCSRPHNASARPCATCARPNTQRSRQPTSITTSRFLFGGQIKGGKLRLYMIYSAGNFIECTTDTPYLQIGEHKYGKPVLDRAIAFDTDPYDALKIGLISMDSTMRSNLGSARRSTCLLCDATSIIRNSAIGSNPGEPYFQDLRERWSTALRAAHIAIPRPPYRSAAD